MEIRTDTLAYWYFRLNGFLTSVNFVIHVERRGESGTDVDILGVRFPYRAELFRRPMRDDKEFRRITARPYIVIAEVKPGLCDLNGPWTDPKRQILHRVLRAVGAFPLEDVETVAGHLYSSGVFKDAACYVSLFCIGRDQNPRIKEQYPEVPQLTWDKVLRFIYNRFRKYRYEKSWHPNWDEDAQQLWDCFESCGDEREFLRTVELVS